MEEIGYDAFLDNEISRHCSDPIPTCEICENTVDEYDELCGACRFDADEITNTEVIS